MFVVVLTCPWDLQSPGETKGTEEEKALDEDRMAVDNCAVLQHFLNNTDFTPTDVRLVNVWQNKTHCIADESSGATVPSSGGPAVRQAINRSAIMKSKVNSRQTTLINQTPGVEYVLHCSKLNLNILHNPVMHRASYTIFKKK